MTKKGPRRGKLAAALQPFVEKQWLAGAVMLVADKNKIRALETVGFADIAAGKPMERDSLFWIASQSKPITCTAVMMLVDEGKVRTEDPVEAYLPEFKGQWLCVEQDAEHMLLKKPRHPITVHNVLTHTSGLQFSSAMETPTLDLFPLSVRARSYAMTALVFEPDTKYQYANAGTNTVGRIIEVVSGMPYEDFLDRRLFEPLGMKDTTFRPNKRQVARLAKAYKVNAAKTGLEETTIEQLRYPLDDRTRQPMPAGGLFSTAKDISRFYRMVFNGGTLDGTKYLSEEAVRRMTSKQTGDILPDANYGFGWGIGDGWFGHGGSHGTSTIADTKRGLILAYMVQHADYLGDGGKGLTLFRETAQALYGQ